MFVRIATEEDVEGMMECLKQFNHEEFTLPESKLMLLTRMAQGWKHFVCIENKAVIGTYSCLFEWKLYKNRPVLHVEDVATHPNHHRKGVGSFMMNHLIEHVARPSSAYKVILNCDIDKVPFYEYNGFYKATVGMRFNNNV